MDYINCGSCDLEIAELSDFCTYWVAITDLGATKARIRNFKKFAASSESMPRRYSARKKRGLIQRSVDYMNNLFEVAWVTLFGTKSEFERSLGIDN